MPPHPAFFVRRKVYEKVGVFNTLLPISSDSEMMLRILLKHQIPGKYIPQIIVKVRTGGVSNRSLINRIKGNKEDRLAWEMNELQPYFFTLYIKPLRKIFQFFIGRKF